MLKQRHKEIEKKEQEQLEKQRIQEIERRKMIKQREKEQQQKHEEFLRQTDKAFRDYQKKLDKKKVELGKFILNLIILFIYL